MNAALRRPRPDVIAGSITLAIFGLSVACSDARDRTGRDAATPGEDARVEGDLGTTDRDARPADPDARVPPPDDASIAPDASVTVDSGPLMVRCGADDARSAPCASLCDGPSRFYWNGDACFAIDCGACEGTDCAERGLASEAECIAAHATCRSALCEQSGGTWRWWAEDCGDWICGRPPPEDCEMGGPVCDCGPFRSMGDRRECVDDPMCPIPEPVTREELCIGTGGMWSPICCDSICGTPCPDPCVSDACDCGPGRLFDEGRGCFDDARCHERREGETCIGNARCADGAICCQSCGGAGCFGDPVCRAPTCDEDPGIDVCGNCTICP